MAFKLIRGRTAGSDVTGEGYRQTGDGMLERVEESWGNGRGVFGVWCVCSGQQRGWGADIYNEEMVPIVGKEEERGQILFRASRSIW